MSQPVLPPIEEGSSTATTACEEHSHEAQGTGESSFGVFFCCSAPGVWHSSLRKYWLIALACAVPTGVFQGWGSVLYQSISALHLTEDEAAWLGFWMTTAGCAGAVVVGTVLDRIAGRLKMASAMLMTIALLSYAAFSANASGWLPLTHAASVRVAYVTGILGGACFNCSTPVLFELLMETVYGWGDEGVGSMLSVLANTMIQIAFLVLMAIIDQDASKLWISWLNAGAMAAGAAAILLTRVEYRRLAVDRGVPLAEAGSRFDRVVGCL